MQLSEIQKISAPSQNRYSGYTCANADLYWGQFLYSRWINKLPPNHWSNNFGIALLKDDRSFGAMNALLINPNAGFLVDVDTVQIRRPIRQPRKSNSETVFLKEKFIKLFKLGFFNQYWMIAGMFHILNDLGVDNFNQKDFLETVKQYEKISNKDPRY